MIHPRLSSMVTLAAVTVAASLAAGPASAATSGTFTATGSMHAPRPCDTATLLPGGQVLAAGIGFASGAPSAELYSPATGAWSVTGAMLTPTASHTATLLPDGQVLVAGGSTSGCTYVGTSGAELYNPATGTWAATGSMTTPRVDQTATLLGNGEVLVSGGMGTAVPSSLASAELYNPATGTWDATGKMTTAREGQSATLLGNGKVLIAGGSNSKGPLSSAELYNPSTGKFTATGSMSAARQGQTATLLPEGQVLVTAGTINGPFAELYNPATGQWSAATGGLAPCTTARACRTGSAATLLGNGDVLVTGGYACLATTYPCTTAAAMLYDPATNTWTGTGAMTTSRAFQTSTLMPGGQVLVAGGESATRGKLTDLASAELYTP